MKHTIALAALGAATFFGSAQAQSVNFGGDINFAYAIEDLGGDNFETYIANGAVQASFGALGLQLDVATASYGSLSNFNNTSLAAHGFYTINPGLIVGGYYGTDTWNGGISSYDFYGVEVKFTPGGGSSPFEIEAFVGWYEANFSTYGYNLIGVEGSYTLNENLELFAGYLKNNNGDAGNRTFQYDIASAGAIYSFDSGLYVEAALHQVFANIGDEFLYAQLTFGFAFGGGTTFNSRSYFNMYPGD